ncbi:hypothetical protein SBA1_1140010 [Candidatus Sulfotelmatobacter kueseliae]|uniref:Uncharacterized protein n=1 Tax=Candidatus Sulfotelmatobacter kueseliae TaxID=2042962 RepID=A0A2U3K0F7_9BACT|nr:hypothetical protein SBA1_1140010 [Candidatus Sulfotelmatobacter kueseliae]
MKKEVLGAKWWIIADPERILISLSSNGCPIEKLSHLATLKMRDPGLILYSQQTYGG